LGILYGDGSAGKSVLMALLRLLLGRFYKDMNKDIVVSARGQRAAAKGATSPLEASRENVSSLRDSRCERPGLRIKNASLPFLLSIVSPAF
jgi:hypothetical protein